MTIGPPIAAFLSKNPTGASISEDTSFNTWTQSCTYVTYETQLDPLVIFQTHQTFFRSQVELSGFSSGIRYVRVNIREMVFKVRHEASRIVISDGMVQPSRTLCISSNVVAVQTLWDKTETTVASNDNPHCHGFSKLHVGQQQRTTLL